MSISESDHVSSSDFSLCEVDYVHSISDNQVVPLSCDEENAVPILLSSVMERRLNHQETDSETLVLSSDSSEKPYKPKKTIIKSKTIKVSKQPFGLIKELLATTKGVLDVESSLNERDPIRTQDSIKMQDSIRTQESTKGQIRERGFDSENTQILEDCSGALPLSITQDTVPDQHHHELSTGHTIEDLTVRNSEISELKGSLGIVNIPEISIGPKEIGPSGESNTSQSPSIDLQSRNKLEPDSKEPKAKQPKPTLARKKKPLSDLCTTKRYRVGLSRKVDSLHGYLRKNNI